jgi:hypothetical protein
MARKRPYLVVYDYGTGGVWVYLWAESHERIKRELPDLTVFDELPEWVTTDRLGPIRTLDIDQSDDWLDRLRKAA